MRPARLWPALVVTGCVDAPTYLRPHGAIGDREAGLGWPLLLIACAVTVAIAVLVVAAVFRGTRTSTELGREEGGLRWIVIGGVIVPTVILIGVLIASTGTLAAVSRQPAAPAARLEVIGHRWWWEVRYDGERPDQIFTTGNEIHIPVGQPVRLELTTADVIHSFWIPELAGKVDLIPGQRNVTWIEADTAGSFWGHCAEYCGLQHANMMMAVVAEPPAQFARWLDAQRRPSTPPAGGDAAAGAQVFAGGACALCHTVRGTDAGGAVGPDLTHVASRRLIAAGTLPNRPGDLAGWIANPQAIKPGALMPVVPLRPDQLRQLVAYLEDLK